MLVDADAVEAERLGVLELVHVAMVEMVALLRVVEPVRDIDPDRPVPLAEVVGQIGPRHQVEPGEVHRYAAGWPRSAPSASSTCRAAWNCELTTWRTMPSRSITKVTRPGRRPRVAGTPYCLRTVPPGSATRTKGSRYLSAN